MANWYKRSSRKAGNQGQRVTRTTSNTGKSRYTQSKKVGHVRTAFSISSDGKMRTTVTEYHPTLGVKRTVRTENKKYKTKKAKTPKRHKTKRYPVNNNTRGTAVDASGFWMVVWGIVAIFVFGWWILLPLIAWLGYKGTIWWWNFIDEITTEQDTDENPELALTDEPQSSDRNNNRE